MVFLHLAFDAVTVIVGLLSYSYSVNFREPRGLFEKDIDKNVATKFFIKHTRPAGGGTATNLQAVCQAFVLSQDSEELGRSSFAMTPKFAFPLPPCHEEREGDVAIREAVTPLVSPFMVPSHFFLESCSYLPPHNTENNFNMSVKLYTTEELGKNEFIVDLGAFILEPEYIGYLLGFFIILLIVNYKSSVLLKNPLNKKIKAMYYILKGN